MAALSPYVEIDGHLPEVEDLIHPALVNFGHFTAMQVRGGAVRGLHRHLLRLRNAHFELFGTEIETEAVRSHMRSAVADRRNCYLRVTLYEVRPGAIRTMAVVRPPVEAPTTPQALESVFYTRPVPHIKHVGSFAQIFYGLKAEQHGFDDALLTFPDGHRYAPELDVARELSAVYAAAPWDEI